MDKSGKTKFLIDGFPRKLDQAHKFDETVRLLFPLDYLVVSSGLAL